MKPFLSKALKKRTLPHQDVYTRIMCSEIDGVGVYAIRKIKKGTFVFRHTNSGIVWVKKQVIDKIKNPAFKKLYIDFGIQRNGYYGCPKNFNLLNAEWYLNHSKNPNIGVDSHDDMYALSNIESGKELTVDYNTFCDFLFDGVK